MKKILLITVFFCTVICIGGLGQVNASTIVVNNIYSGWYDESGLHQYANENYMAGQYSSVFYHNFFVFDLSGVSGTINSAIFNVYAYDINTIGGQYAVYSTPYDSTIENDATNRHDVWLTLGGSPPAATFIGGINTPNTVAYTWLAIPLVYGNATTWLQTNEGKVIVIGGQSPSVCPACPTSYVFGMSGFTAGNNLTLDTTTAVPEPAAMLLLGAGLIGLAGLRRKFKK